MRPKQTGLQKSQDMTDINLIQFAPSNEKPINPAHRESFVTIEESCSIMLQSKMLVDRMSDASVAPQQRKILYIEDNAANMLLMEQIIKRQVGWSLLRAESAEKGIDVAHSELPDIILLDVNLPGMSGIEALEVFQNSSTLSSIPVIALSAAAMPQDIEKATVAGFTRYMTKPIVVKEVLAAINEALSAVE